MPSDSTDDQHEDKVLLVEGSEDKHTIGHILDKHGYHDGCAILDFQGYDRVLKELRLRIRAENHSVIGVIVDADVDFNSRWSSIRNIFLLSGYAAVPELPSPDGTTVIREGKPTVGIWIMSDNASAGMLEDFAMRLLPAGDKLWTRAVAAVDGIPIDERLFAEVHRSKANIKTWLSWQTDPGMPIGFAIKSGNLDHTAPLGIDLKDWLVSLFDLKLGE